MSKDIQFFGACNHIVNNTYYISDLCPRCYGKGYYIDVFFDNNGHTILTSGSLKLQQEILKVLLDQKYENIFHPDWGSDLNSSFIGSKNLDINKVKLEVIVRNALQLLQKVQVGENLKWQNMNEDEIINQIEYIEIKPLNKTGYYIEVTLSNSANEVMTQSLIL